MRTLLKNKQGLYYALQIGEVPIYEYYEDEDGHRIPLETGEYEMGYSEPIEFDGNIALSGGESKTVEYGIDVSGYDATLVVDKGSLPLTETSLIWHESEVGYKNTEMQIVDGNTADYKVLKVVPSPNGQKYLLGKLVK